MLYETLFFQTATRSQQIFLASEDNIKRLKSQISEKIADYRNQVSEMVYQYGDAKIGEISLAQVFRGGRGVKMLFSEISHVDPYEGIRMRGYTIPELLKNLPKTNGAKYPLAGGLYYLLLTGDLPTLEDALMIEHEWKSRSEIPEYVFNVLRALPRNSHPMTMFSQAILAMQNEAIFPKKYQEGMHKTEYWEATLEDSLNLTAKLPALAAFIYNLKYRDGQYIQPSPELDWSANFSYMIGKYGDTAYQDLCRLFFVIHADHEAGNASAHTANVVNSALSDVYYTSSAGLNALAGPLHGLANQECLKWLLDLQDSFYNFPSRIELKQYAWDTLNSGKVIPGYGHPVLRKTDPRFTAQLEFGKENMPNDELFRLVKMVYDVVPGVLSKLGKVKNPWPNVDAISGTLQHHFGVRENEFYTVLFGVSRIMGFTAQAVWARGIGLPIERPKSMTLDVLKELIGSNNKNWKPFE
ncbi:MAG: citrate (Si)-synthase [Anaerolineaceae bacterium]|nr:citrate (Si)-synthase [Anaerolineaceae bacterium]